MRNSISRLALAVLIFFGFACKKNKETPQYTADVIVQPTTVPVILSNIDTTGCKQSLFSPCIIAHSESDSIYSKDGILYMHAQNKNIESQKTLTLSTHNQPIKGDFELKFLIKYDFLSSNNYNSKYFIIEMPGDFKSIKSRYSYEGGVVWIHGIDTLRLKYQGQQKPKPKTCPNEIQYSISRESNTLLAKQYFCHDSLVKEIPDFGSQDLNLSFILGCDTSNTDYSKIKVTKLELKMANGTLKSESFCGDRNFILKK